MKKKMVWNHVLLGLSLGLFSVAYAEEESPDLAATRVLSELASVERPEAKQERIFPEFQVEQTHFNKQAGRIVRLCRVTPPILPDRPANEPLTREQAEALQERIDQLAKNAQQEETTFLVVASTTFNRELTHLWWWQDGESYEAWSTLDFNYLGGFTSFQVEGKRYSLLLLHSNAEVAALPEHPALALEGDAYVLDAENPQGGRNVPDVLHKIYAAEEVRLKQAYLVRDQRWKEAKALREAEEAERKNKEIVIHYWPKKSTNYKHLTGEE